MIKLLIGGSPCTKWSIAQKKDREVTAEGEGWELFLNYAIAKEKFKPDFFLYENNKSAAQAIKDQISMVLGVPLMHINSALVSAQNRQRFYAFNWTVPQPEDRGILLKDILETGQADKDKAYCLKHQAGNVRDYFKKHHTQVAFEPVGVGYRNRRDEDGKLSRRFETDGDEKANALTTVVTDSMVAEPIRVGGLPRPNGEPSTSQAMRVYSQDGKSVTLSANGGGMGGKTGLYAIPTEPVRVGEINEGSQGDRIYDANGKSCAITANSGGSGGSGQGLYAYPLNESKDGKSHTLKAQYYKNGTANFVNENPSDNHYTATCVAEPVPNPSDYSDKNVYEVRDGLITIKGKQYPIRLPDGFYIIRKLTVTECCRLQTLPDDYCRAVSDSRAYKGLGGDGQQKSSSTSSKVRSRMCRGTRRLLCFPCTMALGRVGIAWSRWGSQTSSTTLMRLTPMPSRYQAATTQTSFSLEMRLTFARRTGRCQERRTDIRRRHFNETRIF